MCRRCNLSVPESEIQDIENIFFCNQCACVIDFKQIAAYRKDGKGICKSCSEKNILNTNIESSYDKS